MGSPHTDTHTQQTPFELHSDHDFSQYVDSIVNESAYNALN